MLSAKADLFGGIVWEGKNGNEIRVPTRTEAQSTVLTALLDTPLHEQRRNPLDWFISLAVHAVVLAALIVAPLFFTQVIDVSSLQLTYLVTPAPPAAPSPPPAAPAVQKIAPRKVALVPSRLVAPAVIPRQIAMLHEPQPAPEVTGGVIGGIPGGATGGVLGGIIGGTAVVPPPAIAPPPAEKKAKEILRPGGDVKLPSKLFAPPPRYPALAKAAHIQGSVLIDAVIDEQGNIVNAHVVEGHPLLVPEALRTVMLWKYEPTYLNGVPYPIRMTITVNFSFAS